MHIKIKKESNKKSPIWGFFIALNQYLRLLGYAKSLNLDCIAF